MTPSRQPLLPSFKRGLYAAAAVIALLIGLLGLLIPVIPGLLFLAVAVVLFAGVSSRVRYRLHKSRRVRPYLSRWEAAGNLPWRQRTQLAAWLLYAALADTFNRQSAQR